MMRVAINFLNHNSWIKAYGRRFDLSHIKKKKKSLKILEILVKTYLKEK